MNPKVKFVMKTDVKKGETVLEAAKKSNIKIKSPCKGKGKCGKCIVKIVSENPPSPTKSEKKLLKQKDLENGYRLACEVEIQENLEVKLPKQKN